MSTTSEKSKSQSPLVHETSLGRRWTVPNILCAFRLVGSFGLVVLAITGHPFTFLSWFLVLTATDWLDGKLAIWLNQRSSFGARLDSVADATMYGMLLFGGIWLKHDVLLDEGGWIAGAVLSYGISCLASVIKFRRLPSYHTRTAKAAWLFVLGAVVALLLDVSMWPLRIALIAVMIANLESLLLTMLLRQWRSDVLSFRDALRPRPE